MAAENQRTTPPVIPEDQFTSREQEQAPGIIVVLDTDYSLDQHFRWLLDALSMEKEKYKRLNREAVGKKIWMVNWVRGPPTAYFAQFSCLKDTNTSDNSNDVEAEVHPDYSLVCNAPGVARVIECGVLKGLEFLKEYRQPLLAEWAKTGPPNLGWSVLFNDREYTTTQHFEVIGCKIPIWLPSQLKRRIGFYAPNAVRTGQYHTAESVTEEEIMAVFADRKVEQVEQTGKNNARFTSGA